jgi:hypothetical protein
MLASVGTLGPKAPHRIEEAAAEREIKQVTKRIFKNVIVVTV